ncbi:MAG: hypothetical protein WKF68_08455 [Daejeonella sp.]
MSKFLSKWLTISFLNLLIVATLGFVLRYKIAFYLPFVDQKFILHSHSHFAFSGWVTQTLMVLLVHYLSLKSGDHILIKYRWLLYANLITAYGMMVSFMLQGYAFFSISFSLISIFISYFFAFYYWKDLNRLKNKQVSDLWIKAALLFSVISSLGAFTLAFMMGNKMTDQNWYLASVYFFLHFQYNGWFLFAGMGLLTDKLEEANPKDKNLYYAFILFCFACIPAYLLSVLWFSFPGIVFLLILIAVIAQLFGWLLMIKVFVRNRPFILERFSRYGRLLLLLSAIAFTIKLLLQVGSIHPALSQLSYGFRPIIIGYLHLVLLGVTSIFIIGYIISFKLVPVSPKLIYGTFIFVAGIIINELLLMVQGVAALTYSVIPYIQIGLLIAAGILFAGISLMFVSCLRSFRRLV